MKRFVIEAQRIPVASKLPSVHPLFVGLVCPSIPTGSLAAAVNQVSSSQDTKR